MAGNNKKSYLCYLNKLVDEYNDSYHNYVGEKPVEYDYSACLKKLN